MIDVLKIAVRTVVSMVAGCGVYWLTLVLLSICDVAVLAVLLSRLSWFGWGFLLLLIVGAYLLLREYAF